MFEAGLETRVAGVPGPMNRSPVHEDANDELRALPHRRNHRPVSAFRLSPSDNSGNPYEGVRDGVEDKGRGVSTSTSCTRRRAKATTFASEIATCPH